MTMNPFAAAPLEISDNRDKKKEISGQGVVLQGALYYQTHHRDFE